MITVDATTTVIGVVTAEGGANLYKGANESYEVHTTIPKNDAVVVLEVFNNTWYRVHYGNYVGYVPVTSLNIVSDSAATATGKIVMNTEVPVLRGAHESYEAVTTLTLDQTFTILGFYPGGWYRVECGEYTGYILLTDAISVTVSGISAPSDGSITDVTWIAYDYNYQNGYPVYELRFNSDGTVTYMAGWLYSELEYYGEGTWSVSGNQITYSIADGDHALNGTVQYEFSLDGYLLISHVSGDLLNYQLATAPLGFAVKGSALDVPPIQL